MTSADGILAESRSPAADVNPATLGDDLEATRPNVTKGDELRCCATCGSPRREVCYGYGMRLVDRPAPHEHACQRGEPGCCPDRFHDPQEESE